MGAKNQKSSNENSIDKKNFFKRREKVSKNSFEYLSIIGKGGFGKVWKVFEKSKKIQYALKEMSKSKILDKRSERSVKYERDLLSRINHP
jgi:serine/threonine protein kinase